MPRQKKPQVKQRSDKRYRVKYKGKYFYSSISSEDAYAKKEEYRKQLEAGIMRNMTVSEYALPWLKRTYPKVANSTYTGLVIHLEHLTKEIGKKMISKVIPSDIKDVYSKQYKDCSNSYLKSAKQLYCALFDAAVADGLCRSNPARDRTAKPHKGSPPKTRPITEQEREWIENFCKDHRLYPAVMTMLYAGLRPQEVKAIKIDRDVDFQNDIITVQQTAHIDPDNAQKYKYSDKGKTEWSNRQVPLFPPLKQVLQGKEGYLVTSAKGQQITQTTWHVAWTSYKRAMETAINGIVKEWYGRTKAHKKILEDGGKLPEWVEFTVVPYDLRHSYCCMLRNAGVEMNTARKWMGHADAKMILKVYDSVSEDRSAEEREKIEKRLFGGQNGGQNENPEPEAVEK